MFKVINEFRDLVEGSIKNHSALMHLFLTIKETPTRNLCSKVGIITRIITRGSNFILHLDHKSMVIFPEPSPVWDELSLLVCLQKSEGPGALAKEYHRQTRGTHWKSPQLVVSPEWLTPVRNKVLGVAEWKAFLIGLGISQYSTCLKMPGLRRTKVSEIQFWLSAHLQVNSTGLLDLIAKPPRN